GRRFAALKARGISHLDDGAGRRACDAGWEGGRVHRRPRNLGRRTLDVQEALRPRGGEIRTARGGLHRDRRLPPDTVGRVGPDGQLKAGPWPPGFHKQEDLQPMTRLSSVSASYSIPERIDRLPMSREIWG